MQARLYYMPFCVNLLRLHIAQVGDLGCSSIDGKGKGVDVKVGLRCHSPETICSGITSKVSFASAPAQLPPSTPPSPPHPAQPFKLCLYKKLRSDKQFLLLMPTARLILFGCASVLC